MFPFGNEPYVYVCCFNRLSDIVDLVVIFFHALTTLEAIRYIYVKVVVGPLVKSVHLVMSRACDSNFDHFTPLVICTGIT